MKTILITGLTVLSLGACGDDAKTTDTSSDATTTTDTTTTTTTDTTTSNPDTNGGATSAVTGVAKPASPKAEPTPNAGCATDDTNPKYTDTSGFKYPWEGATVGGDDYTCNGCKTGDAKMQGKWRVHGFENSDGTGNMDYDFPDPATDYAEALYIDGNTFEIHIKDAKAAPNDQNAVYRGFYFCGEKPEQAGAHLYWIVTDADVGSTKVGDMFETDVVQPGGATNFLIYWYDEVGSAQNNDYQYCKIGTVNPDNAEQTCTNPFE